MKIPAIRGSIGHNVYYVTNFTFEQIARLVKKIDNELHTSTSLNDQIQRSLSDNYIKIKQYILSCEDRFFNALVLAVYDGQPEWTEIRYELEDQWFYNVGVLNFSGDEKIFPVDGQHRVEGIKAALSENPELASESICVILIGHSTTRDGMERSRRIFSTLNRYAKPVRLGDIIALDEDDIVAITTRYQLESNPLFIGDRIKASNTKSIPATDKRAFTTLMTLYECHLELLKLYEFQGIVTTKKLADFLRIRPGDDVIAGYNDYLTHFWEMFVNKYPEMGRYIDDRRNNAAEEYRSSITGGNIFFRPIALAPFVSAIVTIAARTHIDVEGILDVFTALNRTVSADPWNRIIWNPTTHKMIMRNQSILKGLLIYMYNPVLLSDKELTRLKEKYATALNIPVESVLEQINLSRLN